jgi:hypothetical protein
MVPVRDSKFDGSLGVVQASATELAAGTLGSRLVALASLAAAVHRIEAAKFAVVRGIGAAAGAPLRDGGRA